MRRLTLAVSGLALVIGAQAASAQRRVTGTVTEAVTGQPAVSATITVVGTTIGTHTGDDGKFALTVPSGPQTIRVRRIGYRQQDVVLAADEAAYSRHAFGKHKGYMTGGAKPDASRACGFDRGGTLTRPHEMRDNQPLHSKSGQNNGNR